MRYICGATLFTILFLAATSLQGQGPPRPLPPSLGGIGGVNLSFTRDTRHSHFSFGLARGYGYYVSPYPIRPPIVHHVTLLQVYSPPPPPVVVLIDGRPRDDFVARRPRQEPEDGEVIIERPLPGQAAGGFRPVRPEERARAQLPLVRLPRAAENAAPPELPRPPQAVADPHREAERLVELGRQAFAAREYGRAARRLSQAIAADPTTPLALFLLAQAHLALGKYDEAIAALHDGLRQRPDWPTVPFRPAGLYGGAEEDRLLHLRRLQEALARHPNDPVLLFLQAYQLWFDGRQEEARPLFQKAAAVALDPSYAEGFLRARPGNPPA